MHANEVVDSVTAPIHGAQPGAVFGEVAAFHLQDDRLTGLHCTGASRRRRFECTLRSSAL